MFWQVPSLSGAAVAEHLTERVQHVREAGRDGHRGLPPRHQGHLQWQKQKDKRSLHQILCDLLRSYITALKQYRFPEITLFIIVLVWFCSPLCIFYIDTAGITKLEVTIMERSKCLQSHFDLKIIMMMTLLYKCCSVKIYFCSLVSLSNTVLKWTVKKIRRSIHSPKKNTFFQTFYFSWKGPCLFIAQCLMKAWIPCEDFWSLDFSSGDTLRLLFGVLSKMTHQLFFFFLNKYTASVLCFW